MIVKSHDPKKPEGAVLLFALIVLMLMGLMSVAIFLNTKSELSVSSNTAMGRDAFTKADAAARIAVQLARVVIIGGLGDPASYLTDQVPFRVQIHDTFTLDNMQTLAGEGLEEDIRNRYLAATAAGSPHLTIWHTGPDGTERVVGAAVVAVSYLDEPGGSLEASGESGGSAPPAKANIIVTAIGRLPLEGDGANSDYYTGNADSPHSVVTTIYTDTLH